MAPRAADLLGEGRAAVDRRDWRAARSAYEAAVAVEPGPEGVYELARVLERLGDYPAAISRFEQAFAALRAVGETRTAALIAGRELSFLYVAVHGNGSAAAGWLTRAQHLARASGDCVESGWVHLATALLTDDRATRRASVQAATTCAQRFDDADLRFCALGYEGLGLVLTGRVADGMRRVDEAAAAAAGGEVRDYLTVGEIYCKMLLCCELSLDVTRAQQWMSVTASFAERDGAPWVSAICRMHYGGILTAAGRWDLAEDELSASLRLYDAGFAGMRLGTVARLADLRARQGRYDEAARLLESAGSDPYAVRPLARLHLGAGEPELAATVLRRHLERAGDGVLQACDLAMLVECEVATGRLEPARAHATRLADLARGCSLPQVQGFAAFAGGVLGVADGTDGAVGLLETSLWCFSTAGMPLEEARARHRIAAALGADEPAVARAEARQALRTYERIGAAAEADSAARLLRRLDAPRTGHPGSVGQLTARESEVLGLMTDGLSNLAIATRLCLSKRTVEHHVGSILRKLGVASRSEALARVLRVPPGRTGPVAPARRSGHPA